MREQLDAGVGIPLLPGTNGSVCKVLQGLVRSIGAMDHLVAI